MALKREMNGDTMTLYDRELSVFQMKESENEGFVQIALSGSLRSDVAHDFQDELAALAGLGEKLVLDFGNVTYLSSACTKVLLAIQQQIDRTGKGDLTIRGLPEPILRELASTGITELLMIEE